MRVSAALNAIGEKLRCLSFMPAENLHNIVTFQEVVQRWEPAAELEAFEYQWIVISLIRICGKHISY